MSRIRVGSILGTPIFLEISFLVIVGLFVLLDLESRVPLHVALLWIPTLFVSVLIHELGHAGTIALLGYGTSEIHLAGFGGFTLNRRTARAWQDLLISLAGPTASILLALVAVLVGKTLPLAKSDPLLQALLPHMVRANVVWAIFNLVPIHPLDGGQVLQHFLRMFATEKFAFLASVWISMVFAAALAIWGLLNRGALFVTMICALMLRENYIRWAAYRRADRDQE
ncbi:MAG TPA: M50 family metallopeptidase [Thermoanaerobaculia bacterium]